VWFGTFGFERAAAATAASFDGVLLPPMLTPDTVAATVVRLRAACERIGRDPASLRVVACVVTAPDLSEEEGRALAHARAVTYLQAPEYGAALARANGWDLAPVERLRAALAERQRQAGEAMADTAFHRIQLLDAASLVPDEWMRTSCAFGTAAECAATLRAYREAGADEVATYGSTPGQNAAVLEHWRRAAVTA
jgi:probable F420-dependent oxidoreductase